MCARVAKPTAPGVCWETSVVGAGEGFSADDLAHVGGQQALVVPARPG